MKFLIIGSGGREHALAWKLSQESEVHVAPGNPGIAMDATIHPMDISDFDLVADLAKSLAPVTVLVGPEGPLIAGLANRLRSENISVFGPNLEVAKLEGSKAFSKALMKKVNVPTAQFQLFRDSKSAKDYVSLLSDCGYGVVVKASGNALGKGAVVCDSLLHAFDTIEQLIDHRTLGEAGAEIVVEQQLKGKEFSLLTLVSDQGILSLPIAQDYKRAYDHDRGANTGGMGGYSPVDWVKESLVQETEARLVMPILDVIRSDGLAYRGILFTGVMMDGDVPNCLEYNVRFGDPETQSVMLRVGSGFGNAIRACARGEEIPDVEILDKASASVVVASKGYPEFPIKGDQITFSDSNLSPDEKSFAMIFYAGTALENGHLVTNGGRVFTCSASSSTLEAARQKAYHLVSTINFDGAWSRSDIAQPAS